MTATVQLSHQKKSAAPTDMYEKLRPKSKRLRNRSLILGVTGIVLGLLIWQILASSGVVSSTFSSSPIGTAGALWTMLTNGTLWAPVAATLASSPFRSGSFSGEHPCFANWSTRGSTF
jgi:hypothetical protein